MPKEDWVIPLISLILILVLVGILLIVYLPGSKPETAAKSPCPKGYCATNIYSGEKICPPDNEGIVYFNPSSETCNPVNGCLINGPTPCTYEDPAEGTLCPGDLAYTGECPGGCRCLQQDYCPDFAEVFFERLLIHNSGAPETSNEIFVQSTIWISPSNAPRTDLPLSLGRYDQRANKACGLSANNVKLSWPSGSCIRGEWGLNEEDGLWYCLNPYPVECTSSQRPVRRVDGTYVCRTLDPFK
jgi:hypothetical protein